MTVLVLNCGSSSLKYSVFEDCDGDLQLRRKGELQELYGDSSYREKDQMGATVENMSLRHSLGHEGALDFLLGHLGEHAASHALDGVGHRVVHGGTAFSAPARVNQQVIAKLEELVPLAPLHQPHNILPMKILAARAPQLPQVACFDTAFHQTQSRLAQSFALPPEITDLGVRRYGFHGTSYEYIAGVLPRCDPAAARGRTVVLHLGNGASMCALKNGNSVATTMGFTPTDGLVMGTRTGSLDPGVLLFLAEQRGMSASEISDLINKESGLLGLSGISSDMRTLEASQDARAAWAIDLFVYRIQRELGSLAAAMGGIETLVFTAGIGENSPRIRARVLRDAAWLGAVLDEDSNARGGPRLTAEDSKLTAWVIPTNEEWMIAQHTKKSIQQ